MSEQKGPHNSVLLKMCYFNIAKWSDFLNLRQSVYIENSLQHHTQNVENYNGQKQTNGIQLIDHKL